ncbi:MAG TPA: hypothetical protein VD999_01330 [Vitreimonas sp.]|nr:hypothetical protein [Vitreimonas sp.]
MAEHFFKQLIIACGLGVLISLERVWGLPVFFLAVSSVWLANFKSSSAQVAAVVWVGWLLAVVYRVPFWWGMGSSLWLIGVMLYGDQVMRSETLKMLAGVGVASLILIPIVWAALPWMSLVIYGLSFVAMITINKGFLFWEQRRATHLRWRKTI